jgi:hypothetical protein
MRATFVPCPSLQPREPEGDFGRRALARADDTDLASRCRSDGAVSNFGTVKCR